MTIILVRGLLGGVTYHGPFPDRAAAMQWAENNLEHKNWWTEPLEHSIEVTAPTK